MTAGYDWRCDDIVVDVEILVSKDVSCISIVIIEVVVVIVVVAEGGKK